MIQILKKSLKNKGGILIVVMFIFTLITWTISIIGITYKNQIKNLKVLKIENKRNEELDNIYTLGEKELLEGDQLINLDEYKDIIEYFEGKDKVWLDEKTTSFSGYRRSKVIYNGVEVTGPLKLLNGDKNILDIELEKKIIIDSMKIKFLVFLYYEYSENNLDLNKPLKREIKSFNVERLYEGIGD